MEEKERENYIRIVMLLVRRGKDALVSLFSMHLAELNCTFEDFLEKWQHDIYHMYNNTTNCCQCHVEYELPQYNELTSAQLQSIFDQSARLPTHVSDTPYKTCCRPVLQKVLLENLDVMFIKTLLIRFCDKLFWKCTLHEDHPLENFLNENKHTIHHLWRGSLVCCSCEPGYKIPCTETLINEYQWRFLFSEPGQPCSLHEGKDVDFQTFCTTKANNHIIVDELDENLSKILLSYCCIIHKSVDKIETFLKNITFKNKGMLSEADFQRYCKEIEECLDTIYGYLSIPQEQNMRTFTDLHGKELLPEEKGEYKYNDEIIQIETILNSIRSTEKDYTVVSSDKERFALSRQQRSLTKQKIVDTEILEKIMCEVCEKESTVYFCSDCRKSLCETCKNFHDSLVSPETHKLSRFQKHSLPIIKQTCAHHCKEYNMYCRTHNVPFCDQCPHKGCTITSLKKCIVGVKDSPRFFHISSLNDDLIQIFESTIKEVQSEMESIQMKKESIVREIDDSVEQIKTVMSEVKRECLTDIDIHSNKITSSCQALVTCKKEVEQCKTDLSLLKTEVSDLNVFLGLFPIEESLKTCQSRLIGHIDENKLSAVEPSWKVTVGKMKSAFFNIGMKSITMPSKVNKLLRPSETIEIDEIYLEKRFELPVPKKAKKATIEGCAILPNNEVWLTDSRNNRVSIWKIPEKDGKEKKLLYQPYDISPIGENQVAISAPNKNSIFLYNAETRQENDKFTFDNPEGKFGAISYSKERIIVRLEDFGFYVISSEGKVLQRLPKTGSHFPFVTSFKDKFYFTQWVNKKVYCCEITGQTIWDFDAKNILDPPNGLSADENGNIFITGTHSGNVIIVSPSGDGHREILSKKDNPISNPRAIAYNAFTKRLLITDESGHFVVYAVKRREVYKRK